MNLRCPIIQLFAILIGLFNSPLRAAEFDVVIYGGTCAAVTAAVQAKKLGKSVIIVSPDRHLGGLSSGGLGFTDTGDKSVIGGLSREFYHRVWLHYDKPESWPWQKRSEYGGQGQGIEAEVQAEIVEPRGGRVRRSPKQAGEVLEGHENGDYSRQ